VQGYVFATGVALVGRNDLWVLVHQGAAMGSEAVSLFRTRDAGTHWQKVACTDFGPTSGPGRCGLHSGMSLGGRKDAAVFTSASTGYIALNSNTGIPTLLQTRDGGLYWQAETSRLPDGLPASNPHGGSFTYVTLYGPRFFGAIGLLPAEGSVCRAQHTASHATYSCSTRLYALVSHDAGRAWPVTRAFPALKRKDLESAVWQFESARVWYAAAGTTIWSTRDGGIRWTSGVMSVPGNLRIVSLAFASPTSGWAIAARIDSYDGIASHTELLRTDDSGRSWQTVSL
jgi:photosystem II stability/assembly factor-like uncharacterized protein